MKKIIKKGVSVIIPTFNRVKYLYPTLLCLTNQNVDNALEYEIVIVDSGDDETESVVRMFQNSGKVSIIYERISECKNRSLLRNIGAQISRYSYLLFIDNDMLVPPNYILEHYNTQMKEDNLIVCGRRKTLIDFNLSSIGNDILLNNFRMLENLSWYDDERITQNINLESWRYVYTHSLSVSKELFHKAGCFTSEFGDVWGGEDIEFGYKASLVNGKFKFLKEPPIYHQGHFSQSAKDQNASLPSSRLFAKLHNSFQAELFLAFPTTFSSFLYEDALAELKKCHEKKNQQLPSKEVLNQFDLILGYVISNEEENYYEKKIRLGVFLPHNDCSVNTILITNNFFRFSIDIQACILTEAIRVAKNIYFEKDADKDEIHRIALNSGYDFEIKQETNFILVTLKVYKGNGTVYFLLPDLLSPQKRFVFAKIASKFVKDGKRVILSDKRNAENLVEEDFNIGEKDSEILNRHFRLSYGSIPCLYFTPFSDTYSDSVYLLPNDQSNLIVCDEDFSAINDTALPEKFNKSVLLDELSYSYITFAMTKESVDAYRQNVINLTDTVYDYCCFVEKGFTEDSIREILHVFSEIREKNRVIKILLKIPDYAAQLKEAYPFHNHNSKKLKLFQTERKLANDYMKLEKLIGDLSLSDNVTLIKKNLSFEQILQLIESSKVLLSYSKTKTVGPEVFAAILLGKIVSIPEHYIVPEELKKYFNYIKSKEAMASKILELPCTSENIRFKLYEPDFEQAKTILFNEDYNFIKLSKEEEVKVYDKFLGIYNYIR